MSEQPIARGQRVTRHDRPHIQGIVLAILPPNGYCRHTRAKVRWENATRRLGGSTHTISAVNVADLRPID